MGLQSHGSLILGILGLLTWESRDKMTLGVGPMAKHREYYKKEGGGFPQVQTMMSFVNPCLDEGFSFKGQN